MREIEKIVAHMQLNYLFGANAFEISVFKHLFQPNEDPKESKSDLGSTTTTAKSLLNRNGGGLNRTVEHVTQLKLN